VPKGRLPSLDGWRAIAITMVMLTHFWAANNFHRDGIFVRYLTLQGTLGVRIFFVLSGFLITYLLLIEHQKTNKISLRNFYIPEFCASFRSTSVICSFCFRSLWLASTTTRCWPGSAPSHSPAT
jgi:hypothetical protein